MTLLDSLALLLGFLALIGFVRLLLLRSPPPAGLTATALLAAGAVVALDVAQPLQGIGEAVRGSLRAVGFQDAIEAALAGLLFAGAMHANLARTGRIRLRLALTSVLGVLFATALAGGAVWLVAQILGLNLPLLWALAFGAAIAPTDPTAVLGMARASAAPPALEARVMSESAFTAATSAIVFALLAATALGADGAGEATLVDIVRGAGLGAAIGLVGGLAAFVLLRASDDFVLDTLLTLALFVGVHAGAREVAASAPIAALTAGLMVGLQTHRLPMGEGAHRHVTQFWQVADMLLKAAVFLFLAFELGQVGVDARHAALAGTTVAIVLAARWTALSVPVGMLGLRQWLTPGALRLMTWGGLRGGISAALLLSLPVGAAPEIVPVLAGAVIAFSILLQGPSLRFVARRLIRHEDEAGLHDETQAPAPARAPAEPAEPAFEPAASEPPEAADMPTAADVPESEQSLAARLAKVEPEELAVEPEPGATAAPETPEPVVVAAADPQAAPATADALPHPETVADPGGEPPADSGTPPPPPPLLDAGRAPAPLKDRAASSDKDDTPASDKPRA